MQGASGIARRLVARFAPALAEVPASTGCGRPHGDVRLIAGPGVYLCSQCIADAAERLAPRKPVVDGVRCRFCRNLRATTDVTRVGDVTVCADCLGLMETILARAIRNLDPPE
jgi:hypothetical protein